MKLLSALFSLSMVVAPAVAQDRQIRVPRDPQISPDGAHIAFAWRGDVWIAKVSGGASVRLTTHPGDDARPRWSPDGNTIAFVSDRSGRDQIHAVPAAGGAPVQLSHDSHRKSLLGYTANGRELLVTMSSDRHFHSSESYRLFALDVEGKKPKRMLLDVGLRDAALSPDGNQLLFVRGRPMWSRKGYKGAQAAQLWHADLTQEPAKLSRITADRPNFQNVAEQFPVWAPDGKSYYFVSDPDGTFDVWARKLGTNQTAQRVTTVRDIDRSDDGVAFPSLSKDGKTMIARRRFDLVSIDTATGKVAQLELHATGDNLVGSLERRTESGATSIAFTPDGKQMAFVAGEDIWVMDRILKEPVRVTNTPHAESGLCFNEDGTRLFYVSDVAGEIDVWEATHSQEDGIWWLAEDFTVRQVTDDRAAESSLQRSPSGKHVAYLKGTDVFVMDTDGSDHRRVIEAWSRPTFDWSPDGKWLTYATQDSDYNNDVWIVPLDGTREPYNLSRHPDYDGSPVWSGDGKRIAFVSRRQGEESDIYYVNLTRETEEKTERDTKLEKALAAMKKGKKKNGKPKSADAKGDKKAADASAKKEDKKDEKKSKDVEIDFDGIHDRMKRISIADSRESGLIWSPDGKKLAFSATVDSQRGFYTVEFPKTGKPKKLASSGLRGAEWLKEGNQIVGLSSAGGSAFGMRFSASNGKPASMSSSGKLETFAFNLRRVRDWSVVRQISFDQGWRAMRDRFYDPRFNNRDWEAIRKKYRPVAGACLGQAEFTDVMNLMLGELNASHMGHRGGADPLPSVQRQNAWSPTTYHLGLRFGAASDAGLPVTSVIPGSPCHRERSRVHAGEILVAIEGTKIDTNTDLDRLLTMDQVREIEITVADAEGNERTVNVRPVTSVAGLLYDEWVENARAKVDELSDGKLGYLHIRGMNMSSFRKMEEDLYHAGAGKDGLIIDVRFNGGGSTTDHVLTALTQPVHAITKSRGSGEGYPQDRKIYASWTKPIVLMCNEHSFSNAEILSHAVQQIGRGRLVGMRTAGGVISTGSVGLLDGSSVRMPMRGWYLVSTGEDMELNGCEPDIALWNEPGGDDQQLATAVKTLTNDVAAEQAKGKVKIVPAAAKRARQVRDAGGDSGR